MSEQNKNFYIITGGPGSGKTSIIEALREQNHTCVEEVARQIIQEQVRINGDATHTKNSEMFFELMLSRSMHTYEQITEQSKPVFFDRGIPELLGYCFLINKPAPEHLFNAIKLYLYNSKVFIFPPWKDIYQHDAERKQSWEEAVQAYQNIAAAYEQTGYQLIEVPKTSVVERVNFILQQVV